MKITFPHMGNAWIVIQTLFESLNVEVVVPPPNNKKALDLGIKLAPESACLPLKLNLGNYIEAAERGADTLVITGGVGPCRFGYYGELAKEILDQAGYPYDAVVLEPPNGSLLGLAKRIKYLAGEKNSWLKIVQAIHFAYHKSVVLDQIEDMVHQARPYLGTTVESIYIKAQHKLAEKMSYAGVADVLTWVEDATNIEEFKQRAKNENQLPLKVGIVGEIYTILDSFTSLDVEKYLGALGVEVDRSIYLSGWVGEHVFQGIAQGYRPMGHYPKLAEPYLKHFVGGHGVETVGAAVEFARSKYDGIIQIFPLTCMPEIVAASILPRIQEDYKVPIMTLVVDEHTGKAGMETRLEAFVDLLQRSRSGGILREGEFGFGAK